MTLLDLRRRGWLLRALREIERAWGPGTAAAGADLPRLRTRDEFEAWRARAVEARGLAVGIPTIRWPGPPGAGQRRGRGRWAFLNTLAHQVELLLELRSRMGVARHGEGARLAVLAVLAAHVEAFDEAEALYDLGLDDLDLEGPASEGAGSRHPRLAQLAQTIGERLRKHGQLPDEHPLMDLPLRHSMEWSDTRQLLDIGWIDFATPHRLDLRGARRAIAHGRVERLHLLEAVVALAQADGRITRVERRIISSAIELARLGDPERALAWASLEEPIEVAHLAASLRGEPETRRQVFEQLIVHSHLDGDPGPHELAFLDALADAFELAPEVRLGLEVSALSYLQAYPQVAQAFSLSGLLRRWNVTLGATIEQLVRSNLEPLLVEIRETGDLAQLLVKRTQGPLTPEEERRVVAQLVDICKTIPALAVFAAPGGLVLLPILLKMLPFDLRPSAFSQAASSQADEPGSG